MGKMTNEEAIDLLEDQMNFNRTMQRGWGNTMIETDAGEIVDGTLYANQHKDVADALELAINALRAGGKDTNVPSKLTVQQQRFYEEFFQEIFAEVPDVDLSAALKQEKQRSHAAEVRCRNLFKMVTEYQDIIVPGYRQRAETAEEIASELCDDFTDFVIGGIHNAAPYCANRRPECVNAHGWCDGDNRVCRGFVPKAAARNKDGGSDVPISQQDQAEDPQR